MKKAISFLIHTVFVLSITSSLAQIIEEDSYKDASTNTNRKYKNEIGIDLSPLKFILDSYGSSYPSIFFRRHYTKEKAVKGLSGINKITYRAYRFRIGSNLSFDKVIVPDIKKVNIGNNTGYLSQNYYNQSSAFIRIGQERQIRSTRYELFYGFDAFYNFSQTNQLWIYNQVYNYSQPDQYYYNQQTGNKTTYHKFGIAGIGGFKYFLIPRLCFSAEATFDIGYTADTKDNSYKRFDSPSNTLTQEKQSIHTSNVSFSINPLFVINMGYYFN